MIRLFKRTLGVGVLYLIASAHVGSPDTWFEGKAGPYPVTVQIIPAGVIPGVATVNVRVTGKADAVTIQANKFDATGGAPPPEPTSPVSGEPGLYSGKLWLMTGGSNSVTVEVTGPQGRAKVVVPIVVIAFSQLELETPMGIALAAAGLFLFAGLVTIIGAAVREGSLSPGLAPDAKKMKRGRTAMALTSVLLGVLLFGGWKWWNSEEADYERNLYKPLAASASSADGKINVKIADSSWVHRRDSVWLSTHNSNNWTPLVEDHGKLMHLFLIRDDMSAFAHLHPASVDTVSFPADLPPIPAGKYRVFADIVHESGFTHTMVTSVNIGETSGVPTPPPGSDDSWYVGGATGTRAVLGDGKTIEWTDAGKPIAAGKPASLRFSVRNSDGTPSQLEPYMGMAGHAVVKKNDGSVFVHLHPMGTISMASQMAFSMRQPGDTIKGLLGKRLAAAEMNAMEHAAPVSGAVSFPYAFPSAGNYRVWVQVKLDGKIRTAAFDARVQ